MKKILKRSLQHVAALFGRHTRNHDDPQLLVLMYHRILPLDDERTQTEEPGMTVTPETFRQHIHILKQYFDIVKLADWIQLKSEGKILPAKSCAITFDDGWVDNYEFAFPILKESNVPATIFVVSDMVGKNAIFWPERLTRLVNQVSKHYPQFWSHPELQWLQKDTKNYCFSGKLPTREELSSLIASMKNYSDQEMNDRLAHTENTLQIEAGVDRPSLLNWDQVTELVNSGLVEIGSHTCHHVRLNAKTPSDLIRNEIINSKAVIGKNVGQTAKTFCFPNGDHCSLSLDLVKQNYRGAVTTQSGWNTADADVHQLRRIGIHQDIAYDKTAFLARISGWM